MMRTLSSVVAALLAATVSFSVAPCQDLPGVRVMLQAPAIVKATQSVAVQLTVQVQRDAEVPSVLLNGLDLTVRVDGESVAPVKRVGAGAGVKLIEGTVVQRTLQIPVAQLLGDRALDQTALVALGWGGMAGVDCSFKVAPDTTGVKVDDLDLGKTRVVLVTNYGDITLSFRPDKAPRHVENFVKLCLQGFYDQTRFHRVIRNFMIQGGCPFTKDPAQRDQWGQGGPGYTIKAEFNDLRHLRGTLSMARLPSGPDTAGSGFFVVHKDANHLDGQYSAFGNVEEGMDTVDRIAEAPVAGAGSTPLQDVVLQAAIVLPVRR